MQRRDFITLLGGAAAALPLAARAQQRPAVPVIGFLHPDSPESRAHHVAAFRKGLSEAGFVEDRNVAIEYRWARGESDRLPELAADLVRRRVAVIAATGGDQSPRAAKAATATIPIVFGVSADPVALGLVASLNRPGGNVTGLIAINSELESKRLGILHDMLPGATRFAVLTGDVSATVTASSIAEVRAAAPTIGGQIEALTAGTKGDIDAAFASLVQKRADALLVFPNVLFFNRRVQLVTLAAHHRVPAIYSQREFAEAGGLMSYGTNLADRDRQVGIYAGRILKGEKPADLPVMQLTKFEFIINLQTAKTLGIAIPPGVLAIADEVIE
jgi:putative ABC transport system substrate-binding protein